MTLKQKHKNLDLRPGSDLFPEIDQRKICMSNFTIITAILLTIFLLRSMNILRMMTKVPIIMPIQKRHMHPYTMKQ